MTKSSEQRPFKSGYVALVGAPNVGKSTLLNGIMGEKISITAPKPQTTRNRILGILTRPDCQAVFVDTPGIHKARDPFNKILVDTALSTLNEVDVVCFLLEVPETHKHLDSFILENLRRIRSPVILVVNKVDRLPHKPDLLPLMDHYRNLFPFHAIVPTSALKGDGVEELLGEILGLLPEGPRYYPEDYSTDQPERFLAAELIREKIFHLLRQEVPYAVAITVDQFKEEPDRNLIDIEATIHVERDSQKSILIGRQGRMIKEIGKRARGDIEILLGCRVFLGLFVRVTRDWRKNPRSLREFGYLQNR
ncbi:MAG TPA: GTPase Era [Syntrophobacteraceae bacterium]|nr:GTPase Era [Syntrophobacteraceae bacterium]